MSNLEKIIIGGLGGFSAVLVKFLGQDYANIVAHAADLTPSQWLSYKIGYGLLTPILIFLGAFVAWISEEEKRIKLVALAIAAPAMITTLAGGSKAQMQIVSSDLFVFSAYAAEVTPENGFEKSIELDEDTPKDTLDQIKDGVGIFFGFGKEVKKYWVIVGSFKDRNSAQKFADEINTENSEINAWVGVRVPPNKYFPVIVGNYSRLSKAKKLRNKALETNAVKEAYLSTGAKR